MALHTTNKFLIEKIDSIFAFILFSLSLLFFVVLVFKKQFAILPLLTLLASILYLLLRERITDQFEFFVPNTRFFIYINNIIFMLFLTLLLLYLYLELYPYDAVYYILFIGLGVSILLSIVSGCAKYDWISLLKINLLINVGRASFFYSTPDIYGIDPIYHLRLVNEILSSGYIPSFGKFLTYSFYPISHIFISEISHITFLDVVDSFFIIGSLVFLVATSIIYLLSKTDLVNDGRLGLLAAFLFSISDHVFPNGIAVCPYYFGLCFFALFLYFAVFRVVSVESKLIVLILSFSLIFTHPYPSFLNGFFIIGMIFSELVYYKIISGSWRVSQRYNFLLLLMVIFTFQLAIRPYNPFFELLFNSLSRGVWYEGPIEIFIPSFQSLVYNNLSHNVLFSFFIFGCLCWLNINKLNENRLIILVLVSSMVTLIYFSVLFDIGSIPLPSRIWPFSYLLFSLISARGILYFISAINVKFSKFSSMFAIFLVILIYIFTLTNSYCSPDNGFYSDETAYRKFLTGSEIAGLNSLIKFSDVTAYSDSFYAQFSYYKDYDKLYVGNNNNKYSDGSFLLLRDYFLEKLSLRSSSGFQTTEYSRIQLSEYEAIMGLKYSDLVYYNGDVWLFRYRSNNGS